MHHGQSDGCFVLTIICYHTYASPKGYSTNRNDSQELINYTFK